MPSLHFSFECETRKIKSQYAGGILLPPVQTLVATSICAYRRRCKRVSPLGPKPPVFRTKTGGFDISRTHSFLCLLRRSFLPSVELHKQPERDMMYKTSSRNLHFLL